MTNPLRLRRASLIGQVAVVVVVWSYLWSLHWDNDGLWMQGDSPRHAANGLFWQEFLRSPTTDASGYALSYYARYPVISPTTHPPVFYLFEAAAYGLFGVSPYVAKGVVLMFSLVVALYTTAWLRRWVGEDAGWTSAVVLLLPGTIRWSHAIMLNIPAFALMLGALYHARRWLESTDAAPAGRHIYPAAALSLLAILTHLTSGVVVLIIAAWLLALGRWKYLYEPRTLLVALACGLLLIPWLLVAFRWSPQYVGWVGMSNTHAGKMSSWLYYPEHLHQLVNPYLLVLAVIGIVAGLLKQRWRREVLLSLIWIGVVYVFFSWLGQKDSRYALIVGTPLLAFCTIALLSLAEGIDRLLDGRQQAAWVLRLLLSATLLGTQAWLSPRVQVASVRGIKDASDFFAQVAPNEPVFYDGYHDGVFTYYVQASDPDYRRQVVLGSKLLYASVVFQHLRLREFALTSQEILETLRTRGGCQWLAIEVGSSSERIAPMRKLREVVKRPEFEFVQSFPVTGQGIDRVDVYRLLVPVRRPDKVVLPFPALGDDARFQVAPIQRCDRSE